MRYGLIGMLLLTASVALADPPTLDIPAEVKPSGQYVTLAPKTDAVAVTYVGLDGVDPIPSAVLKDGRLFLLDTRGLAAGRYRFTAVAASKAGEQTRTDFAVVVGTPPPVPPGPTPPGPTPDPAAPFAGAPGLRVLILYESGKEPTYPPEQWYAVLGAKFQGFLDTVCVAEGSRKGWNVWPVGVAVGTEPKVWQDAVAKARPTSFPWLLVGNGKAGFSGPLPKTEAEMEAKVKEFAQ